MARNCQKQIQINYQIVHKNTHKINVEAEISQLNII